MIDRICPKCKKTNCIKKGDLFECQDCGYKFNEQMNEAFESWKADAWISGGRKENVARMSAQTVSHYYNYIVGGMHNDIRYFETHNQHDADFNATRDYNVSTHFYNSSNRLHELINKVRQSYTQFFDVEGLQREFNELQQQYSDAYQHSLEDPTDNSEGRLQFDENLNDTLKMLESLGLKLNKKN